VGATATAGTAGTATRTAGHIDDGAFDTTQTSLFFLRNFPDSLFDGFYFVLLSNFFYHRPVALSQLFLLFIAFEEGPFLFAFGGAVAGREGAQQPSNT
jgi:hypothetical protein